MNLSLVDSRWLLSFSFYISWWWYKCLFYILKDDSFHLQNVQSHSSSTKHYYSHTTRSRLCLCNTSWFIYARALPYLKRARPLFRNHKRSRIVYQSLLIIQLSTTAERTKNDLFSYCFASSENTRFWQQTFETHKSPCLLNRTRSGTAVAAAMDPWTYQSCRSVFSVSITGAMHVKLSVCIPWTGIRKIANADLYPLCPRGNRKMTR